MPRKTKKFGNPIRFSIEVVKVIFTRNELRNCIFVDKSRIYHNLKREDFEQEKTDLFKSEFNFIFRKYFLIFFKFFVFKIF